MDATTEALSRHILEQYYLASPISNDDKEIIIPLLLISPIIYQWHLAVNLPLLALQY